MNKISFRFTFTLLIAFTTLLAACSPAAATSTATQSGYPAPVITSTTGSYPAPASTPTAISYPAPQTNPASGEIQLTDGLNRQITLKSPAQRIISIAPSNTELLFSVGAGAQVVGRDDFSDYPAEAVGLPSIGGSSGNYNLEAITALKPDLILAAQINTPAQVQSMENLGLTVYYLANPTDLNGLYQNLQTVGILTGKTDQANSLVESLKTRAQVVADKLASITTHPKVYYELDATNPTKPFTAGPGSYIDMLITLAGGQNIASNLSSAYPQVSSEDIISQSPDIILLGDAAYGVTTESVGQRPGWSVINAVKNNKVSAFDDNTVSRPTARMIDALENLAKIIHPEAFNS